MSGPGILIIGAGGHAKVVIDALRLSGATLLGVLDRNGTGGAAALLGLAVLGNDDALERFDPREVLLANGIGSIGSGEARREIYLRLKGRGFRFAQVIHPSAVVARDVELSEGAQVMAGAVVQPGCSIGVNSIINTRSSLDHDCAIGAHVHVAPGATLSGGVVVGENVHIGTAAAVIQQIVLGACSMVAAGAVVIHDVPENALVMGVPAKEVLR
jgi:sugar O-acyltransferase (sialic acid O-acetyltransferase NeuD family)